MFQATSLVLRLLTRFLQSVLKDGWWDSKSYRAVSWCENQVNMAEWRFWHAWFRMRAMTLTSDPLLRKVFARHLLYSRASLFGKPDGCKRSDDGPEFFQIGHNSSHYWSAGVQDGRVHILCSGEEYIDDGEPYPSCAEGESVEAYRHRTIDWELRHTEYRSNVREMVPGESWGYCGHF